MSLELITKCKKKKPHPKGKINQISLWNLTSKKWNTSIKTEKIPTWSLSSNGLACIETQEGLLSSNSQGSGSLTLVHDPWRPVPSIGGHLSPKPGLAERSEIDQRTDVATFTSLPFQDTIQIEGLPRLHLIATSDKKGFDLCVALSILPSDQKISIQISTGILRIQEKNEQQPSKRTIKLQPFLADIKKGDRLRISIAGSSWPAIGVNPGTNLHLAESPSPHCLITSIHLVLSESKLEFKPLFSP